jgi:hypothetical protein
MPPELVDNPFLSHANAMMFNMEQLGLHIRSLVGKPGSNRE